MPLTLTSPKRRSASRIVAAAAFVLAGTVSASAIEGKAVIDLMVAEAAKNGTTISWGSLTEQSSDSLTLSNVKIETRRGDVNTIATASFSGLKLATPTRVTFDAITLTDLKGTAERDAKINVGSVSMSAADIPLINLDNPLTAEEKKQRLKVGNFTISGLTVDSPSENMKISLNALNLSNADVPFDFRFDPGAENNGEPPAAPLTLGLFSLAGLSGTTQGVTWSTESLSLKGLNFPTSVDVDYSQFLRVFSSLNVANVNVEAGGAPIFKMASLTSSIDAPSSDGTIISRSAMDGMEVNLKAIPDRATQQVASQLGYDVVKATMKGTGSYNPTNGNAEVSELSLDAQDMFKFAMAYGVTGYTPDIAKAIQKATSDPIAINPLGQIMPLLQQIKLTNFSMKLTDKSLTGKLLDFQAKQMGTTGEQLAQGAPMMIGVGMQQLQMPAFTEMVTTAVGKFLKDKGTLSVEAGISEPVGIVDLVTAGQSSPQKVVDMLKLKVSAQ